MATKVLPIEPPIKGKRKQVIPDKPKSKTFSLGFQKMTKFFYQTTDLQPLIVEAFGCKGIHEKEYMRLRFLDKEKKVVLKVNALAVTEAMAQRQ